MSQIAKFKIGCGECQATVYFRRMTVNSETGTLNFYGWCKTCKKGVKAGFSVQIIIDNCDNKIKWFIWT